MFQDATFETGSDAETAGKRFVQ